MSYPMRASIGPGEGVAVFRLPLPMNGIAILHDAIERIYGTGDSMLQFKGDQIQVNAPKDGFGPVKKRRAPTPDPGEGRTTHADLTGDRFELTLEMGEDTVIDIMAATQKWFDEMGGINYVEFGLQAPDGSPKPFVYCVQRKDGKTPHDARLEAEAEVARLRLALEQIRDLELGRWDGSQHPLPSTASVAEAALEPAKHL